MTDILAVVTRGDRYKVWRLVPGCWRLVVGGWCEGREAGRGAAGGEEGNVSGQVEAARGAPETGCGRRNVIDG